MMTNPLSNTFTQRCRHNSRECAKWVISLFSIKYSIWQRHDKIIKFSAHIDNGKTSLSLPRLSRQSVSDGKDALCSDRVKAPPLWERSLGCEVQRAHFSSSSPERESYARQMPFSLLSCLARLSTTASVHCPPRSCVAKACTWNILQKSRSAPRPRRSARHAAVACRCVR